MCITFIFILYYIYILIYDRFKKIIMQIIFFEAFWYKETFRVLKRPLGPKTTPEGKNTLNNMLPNYTKKNWSKSLAWLKYLWPHTIPNITGSRDLFFPKRKKNRQNLIFEIKQTKVPSRIYSKKALLLSSCRLRTRSPWPSLWHAASTRGQSVLHDLPFI
jgi:hypothetical protein